MDPLGTFLQSKITGATLAQSIQDREQHFELTHPRGRVSFGQLRSWLDEFCRTFHTEVDDSLCAQLVEEGVVCHLSVSHHPASLKIKGTILAPYAQLELAIGT